LQEFSSMLERELDSDTAGETGTEQILFSEPGIQRTLRVARAGCHQSFVVERLGEVERSKVDLRWVGAVAIVIGIQQLGSLLVKQILRVEFEADALLLTDLNRVRDYQVGLADYRATPQVATTIHIDRNVVRRTHLGRLRRAALGQEESAEFRGAPLV